MPTNSELSSLKAKTQYAFERKQAAWQNYSDAKSRANSAYDIMNSVWQERCAAKEEMNREYEALQSASDNYRAVWDEYGRLRNENNRRIESLRYEADSEHQMMKDCFERASDAYNYGDKSEAPIYSQEGHEHKERRDALNAEVSILVQEIKDTKANANLRAPKTDSSAFRRAKETYNNVKSRHISANAEFKRAKAERDRCKAEFDQAHAEHIRLKNEYQAKLNEFRANTQRERDKILNKAGVRYSEREGAKIVKNPDGTTQVYHGGLGKGDGPGHGHTVIDASGHKTYNRNAFESHGRQNYTDSSNALAIGTDMFNGRPAKTRLRKDGKTDVFFTDSGNYGDGLGHGHIVVDKDGNVIYMRDQYQDKKQGQYLIDGSKKDHTKI